MAAPREMYCRVEDLPDTRPFLRRARSRIELSSDEREGTYRVTVVVGARTGNGAVVRERVRPALESRWAWCLEVCVVEPGTLERMELMTRRLIDLRRPRRVAKEGEAGDGVAEKKMYGNNLLQARFFSFY